MAARSLAAALGRVHHHCMTRLSAAIALATASMEVRYFARAIDDAGQTGDSQDVAVTVR